MFPLLTYLPSYYGQDIGISLLAIGNIWLFTRIFDAITDPLIGYWSDKTNTRWGRRRIWMVASVPILVISVYNLFFPNEETVTADEMKDLKVMEEYDPTLDLASFEFPSVDLLMDHGDGEIEIDKEELEKNKDKIVETLGNFQYSDR